MVDFLLLYKDLLNQDQVSIHDKTKKRKFSTKASPEGLHGTSNITVSTLPILLKPQPVDCHSRGARGIANVAEQVVTTVGKFLI